MNFFFAKSLIMATIMISISSHAVTDLKEESRLCPDFTGQFRNEMSGDVEIFKQINCDIVLTQDLNGDTIEFITDGKEHMFSDDPNQYYVAKFDNNSLHYKISAQDSPVIDVNVTLTLDSNGNIKFQQLSLPERKVILKYTLIRR